MRCCGVKQVLPVLLLVLASQLYAGQRAALNQGETLGDYPPPQFQSLAEARDHYLMLSGLNLWQLLPEGPLLREGDRHVQVVQLRSLLSLYDDLPLELAGSGDVFDTVLAGALRRYQRRHGLTPDGVLGPRSREALSVPPWERAWQLELNRQRLVELEQRTGDRYLEVNIPAYEMRLVEQGKTRLRMKTIIGRASRPTPVMESAIDSLVVNPAWNVPRGIALRDILPRWQRDPDYLSELNLQVVEGWSLPRQYVEMESFSEQDLYRGSRYLRFWQPPGDSNALGRVKFRFPNGQAIFLHDTPDRKLFAHSRRAFSSGCVRLEQPQRLARYLLAQQAQEGDFDGLIRTGDTQRIRLNRPLPIYLTYRTAWIDAAGHLQMRNDIYGQDAEEIAALRQAQMFANLDAKHGL